MSSNAFQIDPNGVITQIIDSTGDGAGNGLSFPLHSVAVDGFGNVYVTGSNSNNAFKIDPNGVIAEIIDPNGDGAGNILDGTYGLAVDGSGNVYVTGYQSHNAFKITPGGVITQIIDSNGDGLGNPLNQPEGVAVDSQGNVYVAGYGSDNAFKIQFVCGDGDIDSGEQCDDGNNIAGDGCTANCLIGNCPATPVMGCLSPGGSGKAQLQIKDRKPAGPSPKDKVQWKWLKGPALAQADFGDPTDPNGPDYKLCVYTGSWWEAVLEGDQHQGLQVRRQGADLGWSQEADLEGRCDWEVEDPHPGQ
jgi:cysteine-rich repeat protein